MTPAPIVMSDRTLKKKYWLTVSGQDCLLAEGDIGAPIYWRTDPPCALKKKQPARQLCWWCGGIYPAHFKDSKRPTEQFGAPRLFSYQSPIN